MSFYYSLFIANKEEEGETEIEREFEGCTESDEINYKNGNTITWSTS